MSFQIWMKTEKPLQQLASEIRDLFALPTFKHHTLAGESYCQFEVFGMLLIIRQPDEEPHNPEVDEEPRDSEVLDYPYSLDMHLSFTDHELDTDTMEYTLQPYYAQFLAFHLGIKTACLQKKKMGNHWQIRYNFYCKNPNWKPSLLYGEDGWKPAVITDMPSPWRSMLPEF
ncbi:MAG TPA: hypothetical protein VKR06_29930 [Ktedonosporobacter sp.]|nr:hypothetical protein [Ktedonosporobacter sp.]